MITDIQTGVLKVYSGEAALDKIRQQADISASTESM